MSQMNTISFTRRFAILSAGSVVIAGSAPTVLQAGGGNEPTGTFNAGARPTRTYSQREFIGMQPVTIKEIDEGISEGKRVIVAGFSPRMSQYLILYATYDRRAIQRLVRRMRKHKSKAARLKVLKIEQDRLNKLIVLIKKSYKEQRKSKTEAGKRQAYQESIRLSDAKGNLLFVKKWMRSPMEGTK